ncbi:MAG: IS1182 family transposase [Leptolyngbya foveolarum]|uniref:IS1182 family transposase n=1 Tax=Leptolyngbya foveolarum TaxID=47253 RepID=A0A2W4UTH0_9CYAN|nr:MAG: IS1182 family transposase [Leptolyngbya foveolarum]
MSLHPQSIKPVPTETVRVAKAAFPKGNPYLTLRDELGPIFKDSDFEALFATRGQPALPAWRLALVTVMQFRENLSDRQAADAVRSRIDWKYLLGLKLTDEGFDFSVLSEFRKRLIENKQENLLLDKLLLCCRENGLLKARGQQRTDATRVLASIRKLNRLELVGETMRAALNELATVEPDWLTAIAPDEWYVRYERRVETYRLPTSQAKQDAYGQQVGEDAYYLLKCLEASDIANWQSLSKIVALKIVLERHYEYRADASGTPDTPRVRWKSKKELPRANAGIESPYDIDARFRSRYGVNWVGYAVNLSETCDDDQCHLITHVETTDASVHEAQRTAVIHQALADRDLLPSEHFVDSAYVSAEHLVSAQQQQIELVGPTRKNPSWQSKIEDGYDEARFDIDWAAETVTCPERKVSISWNPRVKLGHRAYVQVRFSKLDCSGCDAKERCTRSPQRSLSFLPQAQYKALERAREVHSSPEGKERYKRRAGIEGTLSQGVRGFGLRRSRYRGLAKTHLQNVAIGTAINIDRLVNYLNNVTTAKTRVSRFKALEAA